MADVPKLAGVGLDDIVSGDLVELLDRSGTRVRGAVVAHPSQMSVEFAGDFRVFARYRPSKGWYMARGLKIVSVQQQLWEPQT